MQTSGLSLEQAPHLSIPAGFFLAVPVGMIIAGCILAFTGAEGLSSPWHPHTVALAHVGTIGVLLIGMLGALYQMIPVIAGSPVPAIRIAHGVQLFLLIGIATFVWRLLGGPAFAMTLASYSLGIAMLGFLLPVSWSLLNPATRNETTLGMRISVAVLAAIVIMGLVAARGYAGSGFPGNRFLLTQVHLTLALLGWVGGLIMSVSWQVIPLFYVAPRTGRMTRKLMLAALVIGLVLPFAAFWADSSSGASLSPARWAAVASLPAALVVWLVHPLLTVQSIARRKRRRSDASLLFWQAGLGSALLLIPLAILACTTIDARWQLLFGWFAIWGWAAMIMHGMLTRIVPFLVWFHRFAPLIGRSYVPSIRSLLSQKRIRTGFAFHLASVAMGAAAIVTQANLFARATAALLIGTGICLGGSLINVLRQPGRGLA